MTEERSPSWGDGAPGERAPVPCAEQPTEDAPRASSPSWLRASASAEGEGPTLAPGSVVADRFRIGRVLGRGGHGLVYQAEHLSLGYPVAVKVMNASFGLDAHRRARFRREALLGARLRHRNVVAILDAGELEDGAPFLVMEHVDGVDLETLTEKRRLDPAATVEIGVQLLAAVTALGERGVIHRDIKPSNVMLQRCVDGFVEVKLLDFGISKAMRGEIALETLTADDCVLGTPQYMPPEQVRGEALDARADLYSVGCVLYQCLCGEPPFDAETPGSVLARVLTERARPVRERRPDLPMEIAEVVNRALAREKEQRWRHPAEMSEALRAAARVLALPRGADAWEGLEREAAPRVGTLPIALVRQRAAPVPRPPTASIDPPAEPALPLVLPFSGLGPKAWRRLLVGAVALPTALGIAAATWHGDAGSSVPASEPDPRARSTNAPVKTDAPVTAASPPAEPSAPAVAAIAPAESEAIAKVEEHRVPSRRGAHSPPDLLERRALAAFVAGREREAMGVYHRVTELYPQRPSAWRGLGLVADAIGERTLATRGLRRYLDLAPDAGDREAIERRLRALGGR